eukprot:m.107768 g.107768  ORF g.107768 m.107768 type:complete len:69 (-) comp15318_c0_seq8:431-637(-)
MAHTKNIACITSMPLSMPSILPQQDSTSYGMKEESSPGEETIAHTGSTKVKRLLLFTLTSMGSDTSGL